MPVLKDRVEAKNERIVELNKQLMDSRAEAEGQCARACVLACVYGWDRFRLFVVIIRIVFLSTLMFE